MKSSFNSFGQTKKVYDAGSTPVWLGTVSPVPKGGVLSPAFVVPGAVYAAGTPVVFHNGEDICPIPSFTFQKTGGNSAIIRSSFPLAEDGDYSLDVQSKLGTDISDFSQMPVGGCIQITSLTKTAPCEYRVQYSGGSPFEERVYYLLTEDGATNMIDGTLNAYLYNDICIGDIDASDEAKEEGIASATAAVVMYHAEGILIDRTPAAGIAEAMAKAVPGVLQVKG